jgi:hypothetical protein
MRCSCTDHTRLPLSGLAWLAPKGRRIRTPFGTPELHRACSDHRDECCGPPLGGAPCWFNSMGHGSAGVCTALARLSASLAMGHAVLATLGGAALAGLGAQGADGQHVLTASGHGCGSKPADVGTFQIQRNAARHGLWVGLQEAGRGALQAGCGAVVACVQACVMGGVGQGVGQGVGHGAFHLQHNLCCQSLAAWAPVGCASTHAGLVGQAIGANSL